VLTALRAAAIIIIATGLNDVVAGALPQYEPLYLYLAAIATVVFLDGVLVGIVAAALSILFYWLLFDRALPVLPAGEALAVLVLSGLVRSFARSRRPPPPMGIFASASQPLLAPPVPAVDNTEVLTAIDTLRNEFREIVSARVQATEDVVRLDNALTAARGEADRARAETDRARLDVQEARREADALRARIREIETTLAEREIAIASRDARIADRDAALLGRDAALAERATLLAAREAVLADRSSALAEKDRVVAELHRHLDAAQLERARLETAVEASRDEAASLAGRVTELELALSSAKSEADEERRRRAGALASQNEELEGLRRVMETERARAIALSGEVNALRTRQSELTDALEAERGRTASERETRERLGREATEREDDNIRLRARIDELEQGLAEGAASTASTETRVEELQRALDAAASERVLLESEFAAELAAETQRADEAVAECNKLKSDFDERLQTIVSHLAADHETDLGKAVEEREEARAEARGAALKLSVIQRKIDEERGAISVKLRDADERHRRALEESQRLLAETRSASHREIEALRARIAMLEASAGPRPRVLVAHPDAELRKDAGAVLERAGYDVVRAADGLEALRIAMAQQPDVVIADVTMPKMDGRELCQLLKSQEKTSRIRVVLLTRAGDSPPKGEFPPDSVLFKPVPLETLKATLAGLVERV
jgi:CheY-like chemotaxis protein/uncharacterized coiled-coil DUF342 family protein